MDGAAAPADTVPSDLRDQVRAIMEAHWREVDRYGFTVPNATVYPWQWLWDSCFHAVIWAELGDGERAVRELESLLAHQDDDGFVPHVIHHGNPDHHAEFWGRRGTSSITQPPMYGHAIAELARRGIAVPTELAERARAGIAYLLHTRRRDDDTGLITVVHPWETGADNSPRWDDFCPGGFDVTRWKQAKGDVMATIERTPGGAPFANPAFSVAPIGFNALVAFNAWELMGAGPHGFDQDVLELARAVDGRWDADLGTWIDGGPTSSGSGRARTSDALLATLVHVVDAREDRVYADLFDDGAYGGHCGPAGVHRAEPAFDPRGYWRGATWPQVNYLHWVSALAPGGMDDRRRTADAERLVRSTLAGATASGFAEYWDPEDGTGLGATPQSWTGLALVMASAPAVAQPSGFPDDQPTSEERRH